jgi:hypothetical protein
MLRIPLEPSNRKVLTPADKANLNPLFPEHGEDLQKSGITLETARKAGLYSVKAEALEVLIGWVPKQVETALVFPYVTEDDGFVRVSESRCFHPSQVRMEAPSNI